jgi:hypothetical protein
LQTGSEVIVHYFNNRDSILLVICKIAREIVSVGLNGKNAVLVNLEREVVVH